MNLAAFDLNLLVVFDAIMRERSITRAGQRIGLSQPAMSHALGRLRHMLKDRLFVRTPAGMAPTPRAEQLAPSLREALGGLQRAIEPEQFDPTKSDRRFTITVNNYAALVLAPALVTTLKSAAQEASFDLRPAGTLDVVELLDRGELDLAIGLPERPMERLGRKLLLEDRFVAVMRRGHEASRGKLTAESFARHGQLEISSTRDDTGFIDHWLEKQGLQRQIVLRIPYLAAAAVFRETDLVGTLAARVARRLAQDVAIDIRDLPYRAPAVSTAMMWHRRHDDYPPHRWLRERVLDVANGL